jgi:hypothetical protein
LEEKLGVRGAFSTRPIGHVGRRISEISAAYVIYGAVLAAWAFVGSVFAFSGGDPAKPAILPASLLALVVVILVMGVTCRMNLRPDQVKILAISPVGPVRPGVPTKFTIKIGVDLKSGTKGVAQIGFNLHSPDSFETVERHDLDGGIQQITFTVCVNPVDWRDTSDFAVAVGIGPESKGKEWTPTASLQQSISCVRLPEVAAGAASH